MKLFNKLERVREQLEQEYSNQAIKVSVSFDSLTRFFMIGIDHPLWPNFLINGIFLPKENYDKDIDELYEAMKSDLEVINQHIREHYE